MTPTATLASAPVARPRPRRKRWVRALWAAGALVTAVVLFWCWSYWTALSERDALIAELRARGEPVWWPEVAHKLLSERSPESGAELFLKALWEFGGEYNRTKKPWLPSPQLTDMAKQFPQPTALSEVEADLKAAAPAFALAEQAVKRPPGLLTAKIITHDPGSVLLDHIQTARNFLRLLHWEAYDALARNDSKRAYRAVRFGLECSEQLAADPYIIVHMVRFALKGVACDTLAMCLAYAPPTDDEFRTLDRLLAAHDDGKGVGSALIPERAVFLATIESRRSLPIYLYNAARDPRLRGGVQGWVYGRYLDLLASPVGLPARLKTEAEFLKLMEQVGPLLDRPDVPPAVIGDLCDAFETRSPIHRLTDGSKEFETHLIRDIAKRMPTWHRRLIFARLALRLRHYHDQYGRFPAKLDDLCDAAMPRLRLEWFQNEPITYKQTPRGFRLECPESILPPDARHVVHETPLLSDFGLEIELKRLPASKDGRP